MTAAGRVAAVLWDATSVSLAGQARQPEALFTGDSALAEATGSDCEWIWLLERGVQPDGDALERLIENVEPSGYPPADVVSGVVLDRAGRPIEDHLPGGRFEDAAAVIALVEQRLLPIRHTPFSHCLIRRSCFLRHGLPDFDELGPYAPIAWSATVLGDGAGYFASLSVARAPGEPRRIRPREVPAMTPRMIRMMRSGAWTTGESVRAVQRLAAQLVDSARR